MDTRTICSKSEERGRLVEVRDSFLEEDLKKYRVWTFKKEVFLGMSLFGVWSPPVYCWWYFGTPLTFPYEYDHHHCASQVVPVPGAG